MPFSILLGLYYHIGTVSTSIGLEGIEDIEKYQKSYDTSDEFLQRVFELYTDEKELLENMNSNQDYFKGIIHVKEYRIYLKKYCYKYSEARRCSQKNVKLSVLEFLILCVGIIFYAIYASYYLPDELPWQAWFYQLMGMQNFVDGNSGIDYFRLRFGEHGLLAYSLLTLINYHLFDLTTRFDMVVHIMEVSLFLIIALYCYKKYVQGSGFVSLFGFILIVLLGVNTFQISSGAMETQVHMGVVFTLLSFVFVDKVLRHTTKNIFIISIFVIFLSLNVFGTLYSFSALPLIALIAMINIYRKRNIRQQVVLLSSLVVFTILYVVWYRFIFATGSDEPIPMMMLATSPLLLIKGVFLSSISALSGYAPFYEHTYSNSLLMFIGSHVTMIYLYAIYRYFINKTYSKTYIPLLMISYTYMVLIMVMLGRGMNPVNITSVWYGCW